MSWRVCGMQVCGIRVPVLKVCLADLGGPVAVEISVQSPEHTGVRAARAVRDLAQKYPLLRPLVLTLKQLFAVRGVYGARHGGLSSYALMLLVLAFLQQRAPPRGKAQRKASVGRTILDLCGFYGCMPGYTVPVGDCPNAVAADGDRQIEKADKEEEFAYDRVTVCPYIPGMEPERASFVRSTLPGPASKGVKVFTIIDPLDPTNNVACFCAALDRAKKIKSCFRYAYTEFSRLDAPGKRKQPTLNRILAGSMPW